MKNFSRKGFTLVEILIATVVTTVFLVAVFSLYNSGGRMFTEGTWRQNTQKKAEYMLAQISNNILKATPPVEIRKESAKPKEGKAYLNYKKHFNISSATPNTIIELLSFPVCKAYIENTGIKGIIKRNVLFADVAVDGKSFNLRFLSTSNQNDIDLSGSSDVINNSGIDLTNFSGIDSAKYGMGSNRSIIQLENVVDVEIFLSDEEKGKTGHTNATFTTNVVNIKVTCQYPKNVKNKLVLNTSAALNKSVKVNSL